MSTNYEPSAEAVEALAKELHDEMYQDCTYNEKGVLEERLNYAARFVLRRQHERERGLLEALRSIERMNYIGTPGRVCSLALAAHAELDAPKVPEAPTLLDLVNAFDFAYGGVSGSAKLEAWQAIRDYAKAAVEREEKR